MKNNITSCERILNMSDTILTGSPDPGAPRLVEGGAFKMTLQPLMSSPYNMSPAEKIIEEIHTVKGEISDLNKENGKITAVQLTEEFWKHVYLANKQQITAKEERIAALQQLLVPDFVGRKDSDETEAQILASLKKRKRNFVAKFTQVPNFRLNERGHCPAPSGKKSDCVLCGRSTTKWCKKCEVMMCTNMPKGRGWEKHCYEVWHSIENLEEEPRYQDKVKLTAEKNKKKLKNKQHHHQQQQQQQHQQQQLQPHHHLPHPLSHHPLPLPPHPTHHPHPQHPSHHTIGPAQRPPLNNC